MKRTLDKLLQMIVVLGIIATVSACSSDSGSTGQGGTSTGAFTIAAPATVSLTEGDSNGTNIGVSLNRIGGHSAPVTISIEGVNDSDSRKIVSAVLPEQIATAASATTINLQLTIDDLPIMPQQRSFTISATDGTDMAQRVIKVNVQPVNAPDVYLLAGQSNMVGFSGDGTKLADAGGPDEPNSRIFQLNVTKNDSVSQFTSANDFSSPEKNVITASPIVVAQDPLHIPLDPNNASSKDLSYIGMGLSFAKAALNNTTQNIVLVPAAWSGSAFCDNFDGPIGQWNAQTTDNPNLGNTWLFERAVTRANLALAETGGILRGILWHQGESDANGGCSGEYLANLERLAQELRLAINPDRRGADFRRGDANIPFVLGTMSRGVDERGDLSNFYFEKQQIDDAHRTLPSKISHAEISIGDDLIPANGYPCGNQDCIHYGAAALREMGRRYYSALVRAANQ